MKQIVAIFFLTLYLFTATEFKQLFKLPTLIEHYKEHQQKNKHISFFSFIKMHYSKGVLDDDYTKDQQLPFKTCCDISSCIAISTPPNNIELQEIVPHYTNLKQDYLIKNITVFYSFTANIWQPPKYC